jgi:hypothetical protein
MVAADGLAIIVGAVAGKHLPERLIQIVAAVLFLLFGSYMLLENIFPSLSVLVVAACSLAVVAAFAAVLRGLPDRMRPAVLRTQPASTTTIDDPHDTAVQPKG